MTAKQQHEKEINLIITVLNLFEIELTYKQAKKLHQSIKQND